MNNNENNYMPKSHMGMLSFAITKTTQPVFSLNDEIGSIRKFAEGSDDRNFYKHLSFKEGEDQVVICISHANEGCYLRILRYIPGRSGNNQEAWIYVPAYLKVPADMLNQAVVIAKRAVLDTNLTEHTAVLESVFKREYDTRKVFPIVKKSAEGKIAYRIIPRDEGLQALFGDRLFESYYYDYEKILFIDNETSNVLDTYEDISKKGFTKWVTVTRSKLESGVKVIVDGVEIIDGIMVDSQKSHTIKYQKADYLEPIDKRNQIIKNDIQLPEEKLNFEYELKASYFHIYDEETDENLTEISSIIIDKYPLGDSALFSSNLLTEGKLNITIKCNGYEEKKGILQTQVPVVQPIIIKLRHKTCRYKFKIKSEHLRNAKSDVEFELALREKPKKSPIKNYELKEIANSYFELKPRRVIFPNRNFILALLLGACFFLLIGLGLGFWGGKGSSSMTTTPNDSVTITYPDSLKQETDSLKQETELAEKEKSEPEKEKTKKGKDEKKK